MLSKQLQAQIEQEAKDYAQKRCDDFEGKKHLHRKTLLMYAHQEGAKGYASLWQEAEQRAERYEKALKEIRSWELTTGAKIKVKHLDILKDIMLTVNKALTPKTTNDGNDK